jgi:hypothetical protein
MDSEKQRESAASRLIRPRGAHTCNMVPREIKIRRERKLGHADRPCDVGFAKEHENAFKKK